MYEISSMKEIEKELPRNREQINNNPFTTKDDFLKSPAEPPTHRKVLLKDKNITEKPVKNFNKLCDRYNVVISKNSGNIRKTGSGNVNRN